MRREFCSKAESDWLRRLRVASYSVTKLGIVTEKK